MNGVVAWLSIIWFQKDFQNSNEKDEKILKYVWQKLLFSE